MRQIIKGHLQVGDTVDIYMDYQTEEKLEGRAELLEKDRDEPQFQIGYKTWAAERWLVKFVDKYNAGFTTHRKIRVIP